MASVKTCVSVFAQENMRVGNWLNKLGRFLNQYGFDAPVISVLWLFLFARTWRVDYHPGEAYIVLALTSWTIRIVMKILQGSIADDHTSFHIIHRKMLSRITIVSGLLAFLLIIVYFPLSAYNYLLVGSIIALVYLGSTLFQSTPKGEVSYMSHFFAGCSFSFGTALMAHTYLPAHGIYDLLLSREFICFSVLCMVASSAVDHWSKSENNVMSDTRLIEELTISLPLTLIGAAALVFAVQSESMISRPFFYAILTGAALLQILNRTRSRFTIAEQKALAGLSLVVPGLVFQSYGMAS